MRHFQGIIKKMSWPEKFNRGKGSKNVCMDVDNGEGPGCPNLFKYCPRV
jgi:hypothetical protein